MPSHFVTMEQLDRWASQGKIRLAGEQMTVLADNRIYELVPAVRFLQELGETDDSRGLIGRIVPIAELSSIDGEHYMDSVVIGETAYKVDEVYITRLVDQGGYTMDSTIRQAQTGTYKASGEDIGDAELLARILLGE
ncbi:MAG: hypothetical protein GXP49_02725 [Deltaproteobacteria bacterium]|nr:hypothetical protein [Deltaproteobacteria bacterium]